MASNVDKARKSWSTLIGPETDETVNPLTSSSEKGETSATIITIGGDPRTRSPTHTTSSSTSSLPSPSKTNKTRRETHAVTPGSRAKKKKGQRKSSPLLSSSAAPPKQSRSRKSTETSRRSTKTHHNRMSRTSISLTAHHLGDHLRHLVEHTHQHHKIGRELRRGHRQGESAAKKWQNLVEYVGVGIRWFDCYLQYLTTMTWPGLMALFGAIM